MGVHKRLVIKLLVVTLAAVSAVLVGANPAFAESEQTAVAGTPPGFDSSDCKVVSGAEACFQKYGDKVWVYDASSDGHVAYGVWDNYLRTDASVWTLYRSGICGNHLGAGHWGYCNYDLYEDTTYNAYLGHGSGIRLFATTNTSDSGTYVWIRNNA